MGKKEKLYEFECILDSLIFNTAEYFKLRNDSILDSRIFKRANTSIKNESATRIDERKNKLIEIYSKLLDKE